MSFLTQTTKHISKEAISKKWYVVNLENQILGRAATCVAIVLRGKNKPQFTPSADTGDFVVAINAAKLRVTGNKLKAKQYYRYSGYPGGIKSINLDKLLKKKPEDVFRRAVSGMLPKNTLGRHLAKKLKIYSGDSHPHTAQKPEELKV